MTELSRSVRVDGIFCSEVPIWKSVRGIEVSYSNLWPIIAVDTILALANRHAHYQHHPPPWHFSCQNQWQFWRWLLQSGPQARGWHGNAQPACLLLPFQNGTLQQHSIAMTLPGKKKKKAFQELSCFFLICVYVILWEYAPGFFMEVLSLLIGSLVPLFK